MGLPPTPKYKLQMICQATHHANMYKKNNVLCKRLVENKKNSPIDQSWSSWSSCLSWWRTPRTSPGSPCSPSCLAAPAQTHSNPELYQVVTMMINSQEYKWGLWNSNWSGWQSRRRWRPCWCRTSLGQWVSPLPSPKWVSPLPSPRSFLLPGSPCKLYLCRHTSLKKTP